MTKRVSVITGKGGATCVIFTDEAKVDATMRDWMLDVARKAGIDEPVLASTSPVQNGKTFNKMSVFVWRPYMMGDSHNRATRKA